MQELGTPAREVRRGPPPRPFWGWSLERHDGGDVTVTLVRRGGPGPVDSRQFTLRDGRNAKAVAVGLCRAFACFRGEAFLDEEGRTVDVLMGVVT